MGLAARAMSGMACMLMRFVLDAQALGSESLAQLFRDQIAASPWSRSFSDVAGAKSVNDRTARI